MKIIQLTSYPNPNELGLGNTNETYIRIENSLNVSDIFPINTDVQIVDSNTHAKYVVKAKIERSEFRINKLGQLYRDYNVNPGDEIKFTYIETQDNKTIFFTVKNYKRVFLSVGSKGTEIVNKDNIAPFIVSEAQQEYSIPINEGVFSLKFLKSEKKRSDSPSETDFFSSYVNDTALAKGNYFITLNDDGNILEVVKKNIVEEYSLLEDSQNKTPNQSANKPSLQQIFYGAPGTGKSHKIKSEVDEKHKICYRTTFHPDSDYSTFVGAYKPSMKPTGTILASGEKEEIIKYTFVPQAFAKAYVHAWNTKDEVYLVIEEINRGNCAQIFGDLFQLLDRKDGFSEYPIDADADLESHIKEKLEKSTRDDIPELVKAGKKLMLPSNLYIWATMNTSDQSLFPIDSAFKRRWDWVYTPIKQHDEEYKIVVGEDAEYDWWGFLEKINQVIDDATSSEDKKLGYFFVKALDKKIGAEKFVGKVLFYLWNDVFKNYGFDSPVFSKDGNKKFAFSDFFTKSGEPEPEMVKAFLDKLDETIDKDNSFKIKGEYVDASAEVAE